MTIDPKILKIVLNMREEKINVRERAAARIRLLFWFFMILNPFDRFFIIMFHTFQHRITYLLKALYWTPVLFNALF